MTDGPSAENDSETGVSSPQPALPAGMLQDLGLAFALLTRIPVRLPGHANATRSLAAIWAYPLVGAMVGLAAGGAGAVAFWLGVPAFVTAGIVLTIGVLLSGALHEDGLADSADGLFGGYTTEKRLAIMRDSRVGGYGALAIGLSLLLRAGSIAAILEAAGPLPALAVLVSGHALSRGLLALPLLFQRAARHDGIAAESGGVSANRAAVALALATVLALISLAWIESDGAIFLLICPILLATLACLGFARLARRLVGGYTGDTLGGCQQASEITFLIAVSALLTGPVSVH